MQAIFGAVEALIRDSVSLLLSQNSHQVSAASFDGRPALLFFADVKLDGAVVAHTLIETGATVSMVST